MNNDIDDRKEVLFHGVWGQNFVAEAERPVMEMRIRLRNIIDTFVYNE